MLKIALGQNFAISIVLMIFSVWSWYLALKGQTVIEFMEKRECNGDVYSFELPTWRENLYVMFGTMNLIEMILPLQRELPLQGLEWTYMFYGTADDTEKLIK